MSYRKLRKRPLLLNVFNTCGLTLLLVHVVNLEDIQARSLPLQIDLILMKRSQERAVSGIVLREVTKSKLKDFVLSQF